MVRAAVEGAYDFSTYDRYSRHHQLRLGWILDELLRKLRFEAEQSKLLAIAAISAHPNVSLKDQFESIKKLIYETNVSIFPWMPQSFREHEEKVAMELFEEWKKIFGDPEDPEVRKEIQKTVEALRGLQ